MSSVSDHGPERLTIAPLVMKWSAFFAAAGVVVYLCVLILRPFFGVAAWSTVIAITCYPFYQRLVRRNGRVALNAFITSALMVLAVLVPLVFIGGVAVNQLLTLRDSLRQAFLDPNGISRRVTVALAPLTQRLGLEPDAIVAWVSVRQASAVRCCRLP
jgi:predicted PurR-regulated permease PerM